MGTKWDELFGKEYYIKITNEERPYFGLDPDATFDEFAIIFDGLTS